MTKREFMEQLNNIGADETEIFLRGADNFIMPVTNAIIMGDGTGTDEICLISRAKGNDRERTHCVFKKVNDNTLDIIQH